MASMTGEPEAASQQAEKFQKQIRQLQIGCGVVAFALIVWVAWATHRSTTVSVRRDANPTYANFARLTATAEEVILDFGLNPEPLEGEIEVSDTVVMNYFAAKRLLQALQLRIRQHEDIFGDIELDPRRRAKGSDWPP